MLPQNKVKDLISKHSKLETELSSGKIDKKYFAEKSKEYSDLNDIIKEAKKCNSFEKDKKDLEKIIDDPSSDKEIKKMAEIDLKEKIKLNEINENFAKQSTLLNVYKVVQTGS